VKPGGRGKGCGEAAREDSRSTGVTSEALPGLLNLIICKNLQIIFGKNARNHGNNNNDDIHSASFGGGDSEN